MGPAVGRSKPVRHLIVVDLPAPFGPRKPKKLPAGTARSMPSTARSDPKSRVSPCVSTASSTRRIVSRRVPCFCFSRGLDSTYDEITYESSRAGAQSLSPSARRQPGRLVSVGQRRIRPRAPRGQAHLSLDRLLDVPLVPRHGARIVRERRHREAPERRLRVDQGGPRGAARRRPRLHVVRAVDDRVGRLADDRVSDARAEAVLRRDLLPARLALGPAGVLRSAGRAGARVEKRSAARRSRPQRNCSSG